MKCLVHHVHPVQSFHLRVASRSWRSVTGSHNHSIEVWIDAYFNYSTRGRPKKEKIIIERRNDVSPPSILSSSESDNKSENDIDITRAKFKTSNRQEDVLIMERQPQRHESDDEVQVFEEEQYTRRDAGGPQRKSTPAVTVEDKAIIRFDSGGNGSAEQEMRRERRVSTKRSRSMNNRERLSDENIDRKRGQVARRYIGVKDKRDRLWTEITKDLVVKEGIERAGYEYEETDSFYYIFSYLRYVSLGRLVQDHTSRCQFRG